ncbi:cytochrome P450 714C2-like [Cornus florida]|uniref:cytochrome P450 714C2-like n=1 Tax=Cornus florida TaxID=4283 RepID=UPI00289DADF0|nr:cytochrome P450 714C2-like [Cornus florida]
MDKDLHVMLEFWVSVFSVGVMGVFVLVYKALVMEPERVRSIMRKQGIGGPPPTLLLGNLLEFKKRQPPAAARSTSENTLNHNWFGTLFPSLEQWRKQYGNLFMFSLGNIQILYVNQPDLMKEITTYKSFDLGKPSYHQKEFGPLLGQGILTSNGPTWARYRKILAPELYMDKVKGMINLILESTDTLLNAWKSRIDQTEGGIADINIDEYMASFSGEVISRACFGSSYIKGKQIFVKLKTLQEATSKKVLSIGVPGASYFPTKGNRQAWALEKEIHALIVEVVKERKESGYEKDLLQMVLEGAENSDLSKDEIDQFIVDNCKNIYLAANETISVVSSWCLMLLASNPEWQTRVRTEVLQVCGGQIPDFDMLRKMKQLKMVVQETLRLYPNGAALSREALNDIQVGGINIPKGVNFWTMVVTMHTDPEIWGPDALNFNPERFVNGLTGACKIPHTYMPFGFGPRLCVGQHLAMVQLQILISLILSNFSISLSPKYVHSPTLRLLVKPEYGVDLLVKKL